MPAFLPCSSKGCLFLFVFFLFSFKSVQFEVGLAVLIYD